MEFNDDELEFDSLDEVFQLATEYVKYQSRKLDSEKLLYFYARFKQANIGKCNTSRPGMFDFQGKAKWDAWNKLGDMGKSQAMLEYISLLTNIDQDWRSKFDSVKNEASDDPARGDPWGGVAVSTMMNTEEELSPEEKNVFDWCKDGDVEAVKRLVEEKKATVTSVDEEGMGLLHWACDRGHHSMTELLLGLGADINIQDVDGQTALHYAVSCDHSDVTQLLVERGIDQSVKDSDGQTAMDVASDDMKLLMKSLQSG